MDAAQILQALGGAERVVNVGAGAGSYEPADRSGLANLVEVKPFLRELARRGVKVAAFG